MHVAEGTAHEGQTFAFLTPEPVIGSDDIEIGFFLSYDTVGDAETAIEAIDEAVEDALAAIGAASGVTATRVSDELISPAIPGQLWWESDTGGLFVS